MVKNYKKMTRGEKKVAIAKDVKAQILAGALKVSAEKGYVVGDMVDHLHILAEYLPDQEIACKLKEKCTVCARGAMMLSKIVKFNNYSFKGFDIYYGIEAEDTTEALKDAFTESELAIIETCFEGERLYLGENYLESEHISNWKAIEKDEDRLLAIMQNIIDHRGVFKPEVAYTIQKG